VAVSGEVEAVVEVGFGLFVFGVAGFDLGVEKRQAAGDAVLFGFQQVEGDGAGVVGLQEFGLCVAEPVAFQGVGVSVLGGGG